MRSFSIITVATHESTLYGFQFAYNDVISDSFYDLVRLIYIKNVNKRPA